ncbi:hypothetical protein [Paracoccus sp. IB05]|uniref:hypothetical protein n=1 Tax=Paracoccus sp. IB05 TaxID=2779367 RepID=UPI0018E7D0AD|nr:hypothetical protein [Paracoccus sp. IB05]MBJ2152091.1 hypothetical protein [Paracoccus sp. IB05]
MRIVGRAKDLVITGGFNVCPKDLELIRDEAQGVLAQRPGADPDPATILAALSGQIAGFTQPKAAVVVDGLPRNTIGQGQKNLMRDAGKEWFRT